MYALGVINIVMGYKKESNGAELVRVEKAVSAGTQAGRGAERRFIEFFTARVRNKNTRSAYVNAMRKFAEWCAGRGLTLEQLEPIAVAAYIRS